MLFDGLSTVHVRSSPPDPVFEPVELTLATMLDPSIIQRSKDVDKLIQAQVAMIMASVVVSIGAFSYVAYSGHNKHLVRVATTATARMVTSHEATGDPNVAPAGSAPDEKPITAAVVAAHVVAAEEPRVLRIKKLGVSSRVIGLGQNSKGELLAPRSIFDTGWYKESSKPGMGGAVLLDGHSTGLTKQGVFTALGTLVAGDELSIERGDGQVYTYRVVRSKQFPADVVDMASAISPVTPGKAGLNLITCAGIISSKSYSFSDRIIVYTEQI